MKERQRLSIDYDSLFPGDSLEIGNSTVIIRPLGLEQISILTKRIKSLGIILDKEGVTWDNYADKSSLFKIAVVIIDSFPDVLEEASNIHIDDLKLLPLDQIVKIINKVVEVNLKSRDDLVKNFKSLTEQLVNQTEVLKNQTNQTKVAPKKQK